jgi:superfamily II DNA or RNA helicase
MVGVDKNDFEIVDPVVARARMAAIYFAEPFPPEQAQLGDIALHPHQLDGVRRIRAAIAEFGGALLCDSVGTGKTFTALALIPEGCTALVVAPAILRSMWTGAAASARRSIRFISFESLGRGVHDTAVAPLLIVDEAHHARNPATRRFAALSRLARDTDTVLLSATPIHNKRGDLDTLLSLFLGSRAEGLSRAELGRCVLRRDQTVVTEAVFPKVENLEWFTLSENDNLLQMMLSLPPPLPPSDGGDGGILVIHSLIRQWASSNGALRCGLVRRLQKSVALISALEDGVYPSRTELAAWLGDGDSIQLAFSAFLASPTSDARRMLRIVRRHRGALASILREVASDNTRDEERAAIIAHLRRSHPDRRIVVFSQFADTVDTIFPRLAGGGRVAALSGSNARVSGGRISRTEAIQRFAPLASNCAPPAPSDEITLLLTTDLLSEGVNLQDASVIIHLDLPWTPARMEQRLGRLARLGSVNRDVLSYAIRPPACAQEIVRIERILREKMAAAGVVSSEFPSISMHGGTNRSTRSDPAIVESIRTTISAWNTSRSTDIRSAVALSVIAAPMDGFLAACRHDGQARLIASVDGRVSEDPEAVSICAQHCTGMELSADVAECRRMFDALDHYLSLESALNGLPAGRIRASVGRITLERISRIERRARPHERARIAELAAKARDALAGYNGVDTERRLKELLDTPIDDGVWLRKVASNSSAARKRPTTTEHADGTVALIIFRRCDDMNALSRATER